MSQLRLKKSEIPSDLLQYFRLIKRDPDKWRLRNSIIWYKPNGMPSSVKDRLNNKWEYVFFFTKSQKYYFDLDSIRKPLAESSVKRISQENILNQFKSGKSAEFAETDPVNNIPKIMNNMHKKYKGVYSNLTPEESEKYGSPRARNMRDHEQSMDNIDLNGANPGDVNQDEALYDIFTDSSIQDAFIEYLERERPELLMPSILDIPTMPHSFAHFAVFPETLVDPLIKAGCPRDGIVLDPFGGSGTVGVVARNHGISSILIEIVPSYVEIMKKRLKWNTGLDIEFEFRIDKEVVE